MKYTMNTRVRYSEVGMEYMVNNWSSPKRYASPKAGMELYLDLVFRQ